MSEAARNYEDEAREMGWVPEEEWKGDKAQWRGAEEFVNRGEKIVPILKDRLGKTEERLSKTEEDLQMVIKLNREEVNRARQEGYEKAKAKYNKDLQELQVEEIEAVSEADTKKYAEIQQKKAQLKEPEKPAEEPTQTEPSPVFKEWHKKNPWYEKDEVLTRYSMALVPDIRNQHPEYNEEQFFAEIDRVLRKDFPDKFKNPNREKDGGVEGGAGGEKGKGGKKTWSDLPDNAKAAYKRLEKRFENQGREIKKEDYVKQYFEED
jgi:hypothetical protein